MYQMDWKFFTRSLMRELETGGVGQVREWIFAWGISLDHSSILSTPMSSRGKTIKLTSWSSNTYTDFAVGLDFPH